MKARSRPWAILCAALVQGGYANITPTGPEQAVAVSQVDAVTHHLPGGADQESLMDRSHRWRRCGPNPSHHAATSDPGARRSTC